jgi:hypothetical protein
LVPSFVVIVSMELCPRVVVFVGVAVVALFTVASTGTAAAAATAAALRNLRREPAASEAIISLLDMKASRTVSNQSRA